MSNQVPVYDENFVVPGKKDFQRFKDGCDDDEGWTVAYKKENMQVLTKNVCSYFLKIKFFDLNID